MGSRYAKRYPDHPGSPPIVIKVNYSVILEQNYGMLQPI